MKRPVITLLTDFGLADHYVAAMKGVILGITPEAELIDITHEITPYAIAEAAYTLAQTWKYFPEGTTHVAVVDPGVGSSRRAVAAEVGTHCFVAPDNGILSMVLESARDAKIHEISNFQYFRQPVSSTFHGRDVFAPVAAHLAKGLAIAKLGGPVSDLVPGYFAKPTRLGNSHWAGTVLKIDRFGNIITNLEWDDFRDVAEFPFRIKLGSRIISHCHANYAAAPAGQPFALKGSSGYVEVSINQEHAASTLHAVPGMSLELVLTRPKSTIQPRST